MDDSTISNKTNITHDDLTGELSEKYYILRKQYDSLSINFEKIQQEVHDTRRCYQTALGVQSYLNMELESYQADEKKRLNEVNNRVGLLQDEVSALRRERSETAETYATEIKNLETENHKLKEELIVPVASPPPENDSTELEETKSTLSAVTSEMNFLKTVLEEARCEVASWRLKVEELITEAGELRASAEIRKEELNAAGEREAAAVADLAEARSMLHQVDSQELQPHAAKGNSLFAEVEDKRQEMAKNLIQMKQTNARLRRELANKQAESETLLHEKRTIWEQQAGAAAHDDKELLEAKARITALEGACERQTSELARWVPPAGLPPLTQIVSECEQLRADVLSIGAAQLANAVEVRQLRGKLALACIDTNKQSLLPVGNRGEEDSTQIIPHQIKRTVEDIKKKVSFN